MYLIDKKDLLMSLNETKHRYPYSQVSGWANIANCMAVSRSKGGNIMTQSKKDLINKLIAMYPYSKRWFEAQSEKRLWAMYCSYKPKNQKLVMTPEAHTIVESGTTYVLTDAGVYEEVCD